MRVAVLTLFSVGLAFAQVERATFPEPVSVPEPVWKFTGDSLVAYERQGPGVALYRRDGTLIYEALAHVPEGALLRIGDVAVLPGGRLAAAGRWSATNAGYLIFDESGEPSRAVDTYPFFPRRIAAGPGGDIWLLGTAPEDRSDDDHALRRYGRNGEIILEALPLARLPDGEAEPGWFGASNTSLGLWFPEPGVWLEFSFEGKETSRYTLQPPPGAEGEIVLNDAGEIDAGGDAIYHYDRKRREWRKQTEMPAELPHLKLFGDTGPRLVFRAIQTGPVELIFLPH